MSRRRLPREWTVILMFLAGHLLERLVNPESEGSVLTNVVGSVAMTVPLAWLRPHPLPAVLALVAGGVLNQEIATGTDELFVVLLTLIYLGYTITRHREGRDAWLPVGVAAVALGVAEGAFGSGDVAFVLFLLGGGAVGGALVRSRAHLTRELAERTHELEALRDLRERDAVLAERRRIARELHDVVAHTVSVMVVQAGGARRQVDRDPDRALAALDQVRATGEETLDELRRLFGLLQAAAPSGLDGLPRLVERVREAGLDAQLEVSGAPRPLDPDADLALYRVVQEALTNTLKHAGPDATAHVAVTWGDGEVEVVARDTGWGVAGPRGEGARRGQAGMRERVAAHGGSVEAGPSAAGGYEVRARLPLAREEVPA